MLRPQDFLFGLAGLLVLALLAFHFSVAILALLGAFFSGGIYVVIGMLPSPDEPFWQRLFTSVFLSVVLSSLVLIVPGTMGAQALRPIVKETAIAVAATLPICAGCYEIIRTPRVIRGILRCLGYR